MNCTCMVGLRQLMDILLVNENRAELIFYKILQRLVTLMLILVVDTEELMVFVTCGFETVDMIYLSIVH